MCPTTVATLRRRCQHEFEWHAQHGTKNQACERLEVASGMPNTKSFPGWRIESVLEEIAPADARPLRWDTGTQGGNL